MKITYSSERNEAEVYWLEEGPVFQWAVEGRGATGDDDWGHHET